MNRYSLSQDTQLPYKYLKYKHKYNMLKGGSSTTKLDKLKIYFASLLWITSEDSDIDQIIFKYIICKKIEAALKTYFENTVDITFIDVCKCNGAVRDILRNKRKFKKPEKILKYLNAYFGTRYSNFKDYDRELDEYDTLKSYEELSVNEHLYSFYNRETSPPFMKSLKHNYDSLTNSQLVTTLSGNVDFKQNHNDCFNKTLEDDDLHSLLYELNKVCNLPSKPNNPIDVQHVDFNELCQSSHNAFFTLESNDNKEIFVHNILKTLYNYYVYPGLLDWAHFGINGFREYFKNFKNQLGNTFERKKILVLADSTIEYYPKMCTGDYTTTFKDPQELVKQRCKIVTTELNDPISINIDARSGTGIFKSSTTPDSVSYYIKKNLSKELNIHDLGLGKYAPESITSEKMVEKINFLIEHYIVIAKIPSKYNPLRIYIERLLSKYFIDQYTFNYIICFVFGNDIDFTYSDDEQPTLTHADVMCQFKLFIAVADFMHRSKFEKYRYNSEHNTLKKITA